MTESRRQGEHRGAGDEEIAPLPDQEFLALPADDVSVHADFWRKQWESHYGRAKDMKGSPFFSGDGYVTFPFLREKKIDSELFATLQSLNMLSRDGKTRGVDFGNIHKELRHHPVLQGHGDRLPLTPETRAALVDALGQEYKIHLMPKQEYTPFVMQRILHALTHDTEFARTIANMKVLASWENFRKRLEGRGERKTIAPVIVLYTQLGKEAAQEALNRIIALFASSGEIGMGVAPSYNQKVNDLVYYANGSRDVKDGYRRALTDRKKYDLKDDPRSVEDLIREEGIFEPDLVHFQGDRHLQIPN